MMAVFAVVGRTNVEGLKAAIVAQYGANHYEFATNIWFVADDGTTASVSNRLGLTDNRIDATGVVLGFTGYAGYAQTSAWDWLKERPGVMSNG